MESGSTLTIEVANGASSPAGHGSVLGTANADTNNNATYEADITPYHWMRVTKTASGSPTATVANLFGQRF